MAQFEDQIYQDLFLLHLVKVVGSSVVNVMAEAGGHHGHALQVGVVALQITRLKMETHR